MPLFAGTRLGAYEIVALIGAGGMGEVYRARDPRLGRDVAIKVLPDAFASDADRLARFKREAQVLASLNHPHIAAIYGLEESGPAEAGPHRTGGSEQPDPPYIHRSGLVLELVEGPTLADRIAQGAIPLDEALPIARQIAEALEAAHEQGIIHRDLKPANIKVRPDGTVKVLDFGLAKAMEPAAGSGQPSSSASAAKQDPAYGLSQSPTLTSPAMATHAGIILGTAAYMSPEQARGKPVDKRTDIWAFGCVLYEMLSGTRAFDGDEVTDVLAQIIEREPDFSTLPLATPASVRRVLRRTLTKDRSRRLADMADARLELDDAFKGAPGEPQNRRQRVPVFGLSMAALALVATGIAVALFLRTPEAPRPMRFTIVPPLGTTLFSTMGAISPDGQTLAMVGSPQGSEGGSRIWIRRFDSLDWVALPGTEGAGFIFWSPDGRRLGFYVAAQRKLKKINVVGGVPENICDAGDGSPLGGATWATDGTILFVNSVDRGSVVVRVNADGGTPTPVTELDRSNGEVSHRWPYFLPNGRDFLFLVQTADPENDAVYVASVGGTEKSRLVRTTSMAVHSRSGHILYLRGGTLIAQPFDADARQISGESTAIGENVGSSLWGEGSFSVAANGTLASWTGQMGNDVRLVWRDRSGRELGALTDPAYIRTFDLSPDEKQLAVHIHEGRPGTGNLWLVDLDRKVPSRFTRTPTHDIAPLWSPDGRRIAFRSVRDGSEGVFEKDMVADSSPRQLAALKHVFTLLSWSGDGRFLFYEKHNSSSVARNLGDLFAFSFATPDKPVPVATTQFNERWGDFSPDSRWVVFQSNESGREEIYIQSFPQPDVRLRVSSDGGSEPRWAKTGRELFFLRPDSMLVSVPIALGTQPSIGAARELFRVNASAGVDFANHYQVSKDGQRIVTIGDSTVPLVVTVSLNWPAGLQRAQ